MKCALVTGGSRGIGSAICQKLAEDSNYHILINYQSNINSSRKYISGSNKKRRNWRNYSI
jgi:3-oxoacyl-[acyl-carrier protein] reductase